MYGPRTIPPTPMDKSTLVHKCDGILDKRYVSAIRNTYVVSDFAGEASWHWSLVTASASQA
jgi:hypothetical protein